jgi:thiol-disulfide isomerase/thioredoxin
VVLVLPACGDAQPPVRSTPAKPPVASATQAADPIPLDIKRWDETAQLVAVHKGKVVVMDLWSTWCIPCVQEFPNLVALHRAHPDDVVCISVNLDYSGAADETPESHRQKVHEFLTQQGAAFPNVISGDPADDVYQRLDLGAVPAVLVYGRDGQLAKRFDNDEALYGDEGFTYREHIVPLVERLLGDKSVRTD